MRNHNPSSFYNLVSICWNSNKNHPKNISIFYITKNINWVIQYIIIKNQMHMCHEAIVFDTIHKHVVNIEGVGVRYKMVYSKKHIC